MKLSELLPLYIQAAEASSLSKNTLTAYKSGLKHFITSVPTLQEITPGAIRTFTLETAANLSPSSARVYAFAVRDFCKWLKAEGYILRDPSQEVRVLKAAPSERVIPDDDSFHALWLACDRLPKSLRPIRAKAVLACLLFAGLRRSEVLSLRVTDIREDRLHVVNGKGGKSRIVPVPKVVIDTLRHYLLHDRPESTLPRLFLHNASLPMGQSTLYSLLDALCSVAGIDEKILPHSCRHGYASRILKKSGNLIAIKNLLGHSSLATTSVYLHSTKKETEEAAACADFTRTAPAVSAPVVPVAPPTRYRRESLRRSA